MPDESPAGEWHANDVAAVWVVQVIGEFHGRRPEGDQRSWTGMKRSGGRRSGGDGAIHRRSSVIGVADLMSTEKAASRAVMRLGHERL